MDFLKRNLGLGFIRSANRDTYRKIGNTTGLSPVRVYKLAHGARVRNLDERKAMDALIHEGIVGHIA